MERALTIQEILELPKSYHNDRLKNMIDPVKSKSKLSSLEVCQEISKKIKPKFVIESGVWKGQSTWLIEKTLPKAKILALDVKLNKREYISKSKNVIYSNKDFKFLDQSKYNKKDDIQRFL